MSEANLFEQQRLNRRRSVIIVVLFLLFFAWVGFGGDLAFYLYTSDLPPREYHHVFPWFGILATLIGVGMAWYGWRNGPKGVLWATGAWELIQPVLQVWEATPGAHIYEKGSEGPRTADDMIRRYGHSWRRLGGES